MPVSLRSRSAAVGVPVALTALLLIAGCAAPEDTSSTPGGNGAAGECTPVSSGSAVESITLDETDPKAPQATFSSPLTVDETQRRIVTQGGGDAVQAGDVVLIDVSMFNGATGEATISTGHGTQQSLELILDEDQTLSGFVRAAECTHVGDRVIALLAPEDAYGDSGNENVGIGAGESVVLVVDIVGFGGPTPAVEWDDAPEVDFSKAPPAFTLEGSPDSELRAHVIEEGDGAVVRYGQEVTVNYVGKSWDTGEVFDESYTSQPRTFSTAGVVEGFSSAIVGKKVGSKVIVTMPPQYGYGEQTGASTDHQLAGQTLVFVLEIVSITE